MVILSLDPGLVRLGVAVIRINKDNDIELSQGGLIGHPRDAQQTFNQYLNSGIYQICEQFPQILDLSRPDLIVSELVPPGKISASSELVVAAITACKVIAWQWGLEWRDIAATSVKKAVTGNGFASKADVRNAMITLFPNLGIKHDQEKKEQKETGLVKAEGLPQDVFDACAIGYSAALLHLKNGENKQVEDE